MCVASIEAVCPFWHAHSYDEHVVDPLIHPSNPEVVTRCVEMQIQRCKVPNTDVACFGPEIVVQNLWVRGSLAAAAFWLWHNLRSLRARSSWASFPPDEEFTALWKATHRG